MLVTSQSMRLPRVGRTRWIVAVVPLVLVEATLLYPRAVLSGESFFERDLVVDWYQRLEVLARCLREGAWPLWDLSIGFGYPLLAEPGAQILYPPAWAAFALPVGFGYTAFVLMHLVLGALGVARLAGALGARPLGACAAACIWAVSGPVQSTLNLRHHFAGSAWLPWVLWAVDRALRVPSAASVTTLAVVASLQVLAGSPDVNAITAMLAAGWALFRIVERPRRWRSSVLVLLGAALLAAGLAAVQLWPALDVLSRSTRRSLPDDLRLYWSVPWVGLSRLVIPLDPSRVSFDPASWRRLFDAPEPPLLWSIYLGTPALLLAATALASRVRRRLAVATALLGGLAIGCALGPHSPFCGWLTTLVPILRVLRYPSKALIGVAPLAALLAGFGVDAVARGRLSRRAAWVLALVGIGSGLVFGVAAVRLAGPGAWIISPAFMTVAAAVVVLFTRTRLSPRLAAATLAALSVLDLIAAHADLNATTSLRSLLQAPPAAAAVDRREGRRVYVYDYQSWRDVSERRLGRANAYWAADPPPGVDRRAMETLARILYMPGAMAGLFGLANSYDFDLRGLYPRDLNDLTFALRFAEGTPEHAKLLRMGAVGTVLSLHRAGFEDLRFERALPSLFPEPILVWRVPESLPRSWLVGCARVADKAAAFQTLADPGFDPAREVILPEAAPVAGTCGKAGESRVTLLRADRVRIETDARQAAYLVLADAYDPGWTAAVDGTAAPLLRGNVAFRAVVVPAGRHVVEMVYRPRAVRLGLVVSATCLLALVLFAVADRLRSRRSSDQSSTRRPGGGGPEVIVSRGE